ncbi:MAG: hypothetical protein A2Y62_07305 [Candidatus Fischerbacteria bacterium RBG_13_37_8]|uniref:Fibronectin type-III domain-containing protein n=1 Tax=Candidatus Fischerbacteria bacterium RBG_13_37_8 TaxID=1817863 RepID=A0A1F5VJ48_9BACT|nr:MAG: hypothetical protein A2Y62_07305 [Candidatus Fischerbacteria bacterium RBG_13_37_8]
MYSKVRKSSVILLCLLVIAITITSLVAYGFKVREELNPIEAKEFSIDEIYISSSEKSLDQIFNQLSNRDEWSSFLANNKDAYAYFDPRSGRPSGIYTVIPIIPGTGMSNHITMESLSKSLGYPVTEITEAVVNEIVMQHVSKNASLLNINLNELGSFRTTHPADYLWHVNISRHINGIPVKDSRITFVINHGNLILWGVEKWGDINLATNPAVNLGQALRTGFDYIGGQLPTDKLIKKSHLEIIQLDPKWDGAAGKGYDHALVWNFTFQREGYVNTWEMLVDAHIGKLISLRDTNAYMIKKIVGSIYPLSNDGCCPDGCAVADTPAAYMNTGFPSPNNYTNFGGMYNYTSGVAVTSLDGLYVEMGTDSCGTILETSATGDIDLAGANGDHDCTVPSGHSAGDTMSSKSCALEVTYRNRQARNYLNLSWLDAPISCNVNIPSTCNAYYNGTINFYRSGGGCRNTGEIAAIFDHEWGHGIDYNDGAPSGSSPNEAIADLAAAYRLHNSCIGRGFLWTAGAGCGIWNTCPTDPGTNYGSNCSGYHSSECCTSCTGVRDIDYMKHTGTDPDTPINFTCVICTSGGGTPCGKETHCEGVPPAQVGWDLAARDLQAAPFNMDSLTAFAVGESIALRGHNNVTSWYSCTCPSTVSGCAAVNAYPNWIAADDDDGNVNNGTPHMTAIYAAFNRHAIACATPTPQNSGCTTPNTAPVLTATPGSNSIALSWTAVAGAANYRVFRTVGIMGCDFGSVIIATVTGTTYTDNQTLNGSTYYFTIQAVGSNPACTGPLSNCASAVPVPCTSCAAYVYGSASIQSITGGDNDAYMDNCESATIGVTIQNVGTAIAQNTNVTITAASPFLSITTPMPINVGNIPVGGTVNTTFNATIGAGVTKATCLETGTYNISVQSTGQNPAAEDTFGLLHEIDITTGTVNWPFETGLEGWTISQGTWESSTARYNPGGSTASLHSSELTDLACDVIMSPEIEPTAATKLTLYNWYNIEHINNGYWWDRAQIHAVNSTTSDRTLLTPTLGKLFKTGPWYDYPEYCNAIGTTPGWAGQATTPDRTWLASGGFNLAALAGEKLRLELKMFTDEGGSYENIYIDDMTLTNVKYEGCDVRTDSCIPAPQLQPYNNAKPVVNDGGNGIIEPDENAALVGTLENTGTSAASSVTGTLTTSDATINITDANASYPNIAVGGHQTCTNCYALTAPFANRPGLHWDFTVTENASATGYGPNSFDYTYHVGESFSDVPTNNLFYGLIEALLHSGVTSGCTATQYCPSSNVMREAMAKFICFAMNSSNYGACITTSCGQLFGDVPNTNPFCSSIEALYKLGIVSGCQASPLLYCPAINTDRQAMAKFICLGLESANPGSCTTASCTNIFTDVTSGNPFCPFIEALYNAGVVNGCSTSPLMYCPNNLVTREQMAKFLVNGFGFTL